jgi:hypothetical protein
MILTKTKGADSSFEGNWAAVVIAQPNKKTNAIANDFFMSLPWLRLGSNTRWPIRHCRELALRISRDSVPDHPPIQEFFLLWLYLVNLDVGFFDFSSLNSSDYVLML